MLDVAVPFGVTTDTRPEVAVGTVAVIVVTVAETTAAYRPLTSTLLLFGVGSKPAPAIVIVPPWLDGDGVTLLIVGAVPDIAVKPITEIAVPAGVVTETGPLAAPEGTATTICVELTDVGVAVWPLKLTVVSEIVSKPVPKIVTTEPGDPLEGDTCATNKSVGANRTTDKMFPTAS